MCVRGVFEVCLFCLFLRFFCWNFESLMLMLDFWKCSNWCDIFYWFISKFDVDYFEQNCSFFLSVHIFFKIPQTNHIRDALFTCLRKHGYLQYPKMWCQFRCLNYRYRSDIPPPEVV
jgi:hypothetical protein